jgi:N6-adenosine-specific RNA methylase IME4
MPTARYRVVYADPPWQYSNNGAILNDKYGAAERHYPTMSLTELCALDVRGLCEDDAVLFLWATSPMLPSALDVMRAWGFQYKTSFVWDKVKHNFGHYNSVRHELLLIGTRGVCTPDNTVLHDSVQVIERTEHSVKPEEFRKIIDTLYTRGKRMELFARRPAEGWDTWGNENGATKPA